MNRKKLELILQQGEGYKIEFKESLNNIDKELAAFANSSGGKIFIGITDDEEIKGVNVSNKLKSQIQDIANNCDPQIKVIIEEFENILIIKVREGNDKPYKCTSGFYARVGPNSQKLSRDEIIEFFKSEGKIRFDELTEPKFKYPKDFDKSKLLGFLELAGLSKSMKPESVLVNLNVAEKQETKLYFNNSGVLFFAKEPQRFVPWSVFTVVLFKDKTGVDVIDRKEITGSLFEIVDKVMDFIKLYAKVAYRFTGMPQREEIYEYPFEAVREAVINSVMHKDYFEHGHNNILKFFPYENILFCKFTQIIISCIRAYIAEISIITIRYLTIFLNKINRLFLPFIQFVFQLNVRLFHFRHFQIFPAWIETKIKMRISIINLRIGRILFITNNSHSIHAGTNFLTKMNP